MENRQGPALHSELCQELDLNNEDQIEALRRRLVAMVRDGQIICNRSGAFGAIDKMNLIRGRVQGHPDGFGFLIADQGGDDIFLNTRQMNCVFDGDRVLARVVGKDHRGRKEGKIVDVLQRNTEQVVGRFKEESGIGFVTPENKRIALDILIPPSGLSNAKQGDIVTVEITEQPQFRKQPTGRVIDVLGEHMAPGMEIDVALRSHDIPHEWPSEVTAQADGFAKEVTEADKAGRVDLTNKPFVTIDGEDARDFDDAVYANRKRDGGWRLFVAIADVSHYVKPDSPLDKEAFIRGTSVYFPERVIPMLPEALSNGLCSLNPGVDRLAMVCEVELGPRGKVLSYKFYEAVIHSHARLTYTKVGAMLMDNDPELGAELRKQYKSLMPHLDCLYDLYKVLRQTRTRRGAIDFETTETRIVFDDQRKIERIVPVVRNDAHKLIEECMLCANVCAAEFMETLEIPALYRVHEGPSFERLEKLRSYLGELGLELGGGLKPTPKDYQKLLKLIGDREDFDLIQTVLLRSLSQAVYQPDNQGHFGLGYTAYAHFTSPIRRYPDLLIHRALRSVIQGPEKTALVKRVKTTQKTPVHENYPYGMPQMLQFGEHCSMTERRADEATWDVIAWLKCEYMQDHIGDAFTGTISSVAPFGIFVQLDDIHVEGLVHVTSLNSDYYNYDDTGHRLIGERTRTVYGLGDKLEVRVVRVDLDDRKIDFELLSQGKKSKRGGKKKMAPAIDTAGNRKKLTKAKKIPGKKKPKTSRKKKKFSQ